MKFILSLLFFFAFLAFTGCEKEHTGYLFTENANYPIDSLAITRYEDYNKEIIRLEEQMSSYSGEISDSLATLSILEEQESKLIEEYDRLEAIALKRAAAYYAYVDQFDEDARSDELLAEAVKAQNAQLEQGFIVQACVELIERNKKRVTGLCQAAGLPTPFAIAKELKELQKQLHAEIPWITSCIEQLLGTEPIVYTLENVRSDRGTEAAADFSNYLSVIGGGRMYVDTRVNSPAGKYIISLRVTNEGYSRVLTDVFTFVLR